MGTPQVVLCYPVMITSLRKMGAVCTDDNVTSFSDIKELRIWENMVKLKFSDVDYIFMTSFGSNDGRFSTNTTMAYYSTSASTKRTLQKFLINYYGIFMIITQVLMLIL